MSDTVKLVIDDLNQLFLSKMIVTDYINQSGNIDESDSKILPVIDPLAMNLLNYDTVKSLIKNIFDVAEKDYILTNYKSSAKFFTFGVDGTSGELNCAQPETTPTDEVSKNNIRASIYFNLNKQYTTDYFQKLILQSWSLPSSTTVGGLIQVCGVGIKNTDVQKNICKPLFKILNDGKYITRDTIIDEYSDFNVGNFALMEKHYNEIFLLWNTYKTLEDKMKIFISKGTKYDKWGLFFIKNWKRILHMYIQVALYEVIVDKYGLTSVNIPGIFDGINSIGTLGDKINNVTTGTTRKINSTIFDKIKSTTATNDEGILDGDEMIEPENTSSMRSDYQNLKARMISMQNKEETMKKRLNSTKVKKMLYMALFLLFVISVIFFLIVDVKISLDIKAKVIMVISSVIIISLVINELVSMFQRRL